MVSLDAFSERGNFSIPPSLQAPPARTIARLMTIARDDLSKAGTITIAPIEGGVTRGNEEVW